jgi:hypothetical protein
VPMRDIGQDFLSEPVAQQKRTFLVT